jgi:hypothetical protein
MFAPKQSLAPSPREGHSAIAALAAAGEQELPDARLTDADRRFARRLLVVASRRLSDEGMMHLAGGAEYTAHCERFAREGRQV